MFGQGHAVMHRPLHLSPRQGALLGIIWIAVQKSWERQEGALVDPVLLGDLIFTAQQRRLVDPSAHFQFTGTSLPHLEAPGLRNALKALKDAGILHIPENGGQICFLGTSFFELPTGIFRHLDFFGFAALVEEFTTGGDR